MPNQLFATKSIAEFPGQESSANQLQRVLCAPALTLLGIGAMIGTDIFVLTGTAAAQHAGPALALSVRAQLNSSQPRFKNGSAH
jgi:APA family basic amino acid/polyamine antiporter